MTRGSPPDSLGFRPMEASEGDVSLFADCFSANEMPRDIESLRWQYLRNPTGQVFVDFALSGTRIASIYATQPAFFRLKDQVGVAAQSVDTLVDRDFRGRGLFTRRAQVVYDRIREAGGGLVYGFPNGHSARGFFGKLGWTSLDPVPFIVRPLRTGYFFSKLFKKASVLDWPLPVRGSTAEFIVDNPPLDHRFDSLWHAFSNSIECAVDRDATYMKWRLNKPNEHYQTLGVFSGEELQAFCAFKVVDKHGGRIAYIVELLHRPESEAAATALLNEALRRAKSQRADLAMAWNFRHSPNHRAFKRAWFAPLPTKLRPIELHFGVLPLGDGAMVDVVTRRENWYLSYCDSDTV